MYKVFVEGKTEAMLLGDLLIIDVAAIKRETTRKVADLHRMWMNRWRTIPRVAVPACARGPRASRFLKTRTPRG